MKIEEKPVRIAHVVGKWFGGGVEAVIMNYYRHIDRNRIQFDFICDEDSTNIPYEEIERLGGKVIIVPPYQKVWQYQKEMKKVLKEGNYKIVHSHINTLSVFPLRAAKKAGVPIRIAHSHSTSNKKEWKRTLIKNMLRPFSRTYATNFMCCSEHAGRWLFGNKLYDEGKVYVLNNAIELEKFQYDENIRKNKRNELNITDDTFVIGHIGRFVAQKNHTFIVDIFHEIVKKHEKSLLLLVGQGPLKDEIMEKVVSLGMQDKVKFLGQRNDANELYQAFDVFVLPSLYEGLGIVTIEAQCAGLPCICSTEVPHVVKLTNLVKFMRLKDGANVWANQILQSRNQQQRSIDMNNIRNAGYDIQHEVKHLEEKYSKLMEIGE